MSVAAPIDTGTPELEARLDGGVLTLTLNRPQARNAMTTRMVAALAEQLASAERDDAVKCVVLTGAGQGFCAGGDVKAMAEDGDAAGGAGSGETAVDRQRRAHHATAGKLRTMPKPTIAAINGAAAGAGLALALACDLRLMSTGAVLTTAFAKVGLSGDFGGSIFMTQLVGTAKARELYFLSERVGAAEAVRLGLANWSCEPAELPARAAHLAARLAGGASVALGLMKANLNRAVTGTLDECLDQEATNHIRCFSTRDHHEAARAFVEKREAVFEGR